VICRRRVLLSRCRLQVAQCVLLGLTGIRADLQALFVCRTGEGTGLLDISGPAQEAEGVLLGILTHVSYLNDLSRAACGQSRSGSCENKSGGCNDDGGCAHSFAFYGIGFRNHEIVDGLVLWDYNFW
jgi:hypothetical protein